LHRELQGFDFQLGGPHVEETRPVLGDADRPVAQVFTGDGNHLARAAEAEGEGFGFTLVDVEGEALFAGDVG